MSVDAGKRKILGRGLDALIPSSSGPPLPRAAAIAMPAPGPRDYFHAPIEALHPGPEQPRRDFDEQNLAELASTIKAQGIINPIIVRERPTSDGGGYWIIAGERRWRAAQRAGLREVPVLLRDSDHVKSLEAALVDNLQRVDLNPIEEAEAYKRLADELGYTQEQIADRVGKERATVANGLRLLKLPEGVREMVRRAALSMGHARALLGLESAAAIERCAAKVVARALSVRATEELVRKERGAESAPAKGPAAPAKSASVKDLEQRLTRHLGARVAVQDKGTDKGGSIEIAYANLDDLDRLIEVLLAARGSR